MNILLIDFGSFIQPDIMSTLKKMGIRFKNLSYKFPMGDEGKFHNEEFESLMQRELKASHYDAVFSTNLLPVAGKVSFNNNLPYLAWSYDSPINLTSREYFDLPNVSVFLFDRIECEKFRSAGYDNFHHLPLAVNCDRLDKIKPSKKFNSDISLVGNLYSSTYPMLRAQMNEHEQGYCDALVNAQLITYGAYLIDNCINEELLTSINTNYNEGNSDLKGINLTAAQLSYSLASHVTHLERISLLNILSKKHEVNLFTGEHVSTLSMLSGKIKLNPPVSYLEEMPSVFKSSKINLCPTLKITQSGIPLRALDIIGSHSFLLSNWQNELAENFIDGYEVVMYESIEDAIAKAKFYLKNDAERNKVIENGYKKASENFRYEDRISEMLMVLQSKSRR